MPLSELAQQNADNPREEIARLLLMADRAALMRGNSQNFTKTVLLTSDFCPHGDAISL